MLIFKKMHLLFFSFIMLSIFSFSEKKGTIKVEFTEIRNKKGFIWVSLYKSSEGFPKNGKVAMRKGKIILKENNSISFTDLPFGEYAIAVLHDENENEKMDFNFLGIPQEGFGFSNNAKVTFGPPSFEEAKFNLNSTLLELKIKLRYF